MTDNANTRAAQAATIGHNQPPRDTSLMTLPLENLGVWSVAKEQADDVTKDVIDEEATLLAEVGQRAPLPARWTKDGQIEVVAAAHVLRAIGQHNEQHPENLLEVGVRLFKQLDAETAFRTLAQQIEPSHSASSLARGRFYLHAVADFGSEAEAAKHCRVSKGAISKNLDVVRAHAHVKDKVLIARDISQRDGMWLMRVVGREPDGKDAPNAKDRATVLETLGTLKVAPANKLFAQLRAALKVEKPHRGEQVLRHGGRAIARVRKKKGEIVRIDLAHVGDIELDTIIGVLREALASARRKLI